MKFGKLLAFAALVACSGTPTSFAGSYTVAVTNQANACGFANWQEGNTTSAIPVTFTQDGSNAQLNIQGLVGAYVALVTGSSSIQGTVSGDTFTGEYLGTKPITQNACSYTVNMKVDTKLANNIITGTLAYVPITNGDPSCGALTGCTNEQTVSGNKTGP